MAAIVATGGGMAALDVPVAVATRAAMLKSHFMVPVKAGKIRQAFQVHPVLLRWCDVDMTCLYCVEQRL